MATVFETLIEIRDSAEINQAGLSAVKAQLEEQLAVILDIPASGSRAAVIDRLEREVANIGKAQGSMARLRDAAANEAAALNAVLPALPDTGGIHWSTDTW